MQKEEIERFSRQILVPYIRVSGQEKLKNSSVLVIGAGGLGCPCSLYLASSGVGRIGIVDYDVVEITNLNRQILHKEASIGRSKVQSAKEELEKVNSKCVIETYDCALNPDNALNLCSKYDIIVDASDNVFTRYLVNDASVVLGKPLVSGSALGMNGQITVYNHLDSPCYRCIHPVPPPKESVQNCSESGVVSPVTGIVGSLQAMEVIRLATHNTSAYAGQLMTFDGETGSFRKFKLRPKDSNCFCSKRTMLLDYYTFCGSGPDDKCSMISVLRPDERISCEDYRIANETDDHLVLDVRDRVQYEIFRLPNSKNIPYSEMECMKDEELSELIGSAIRIIVVCRRGNDSQLAVQRLKSIGYVDCKDIIGGLQRWSIKIDPSLPLI